MIWTKLEEQRTEMPQIVITKKPHFEIHFLGLIGEAKQKLNRNAQSSIDTVYKKQNKTKPQRQLRFLPMDELDLT